ncbi:MAG: MBL fold metallo-hydrolase [Saccharospirillum sp.]|nr:MBL fold metallo-hydrolase [Saccharospirillum sp.]
MKAPFTLKFLGAARYVTGSCYLLTIGKKRVLLDCGMVQGDDQVKEWHRYKFPFKPESIDLVIISHAHIDHCGLLPLLVASGYKGPILCTNGTRKLLPVLLKDSVFLYLKDLEWKNKRLKRRGKPPMPSVMSEKDVDRVMELADGLPYGKHKAPIPGLELMFSDAGHILGSAIVQLWIKQGQSARHLVFSGDLGNPDTVLMNDPTPVEQADIVLMEGTYGNRDHRPLDDTLEEFAQVLESAFKAGGNVFIPAFALGRTQEILYFLGQLYHQGRLKQQLVFLDSPMAQSITSIYNDNLQRLNRDDTQEMYNQNAGDFESFLPILRMTETVEESMAINRVTQGAIIIAGSGMCNGGRITHHLKHNLWRSQNHLIFVGFQARGTLGRRLVDGATTVKLFGQDIAVKAQVHTLGGFSAHAGQAELLAWAKGIAGQPRFFLVHGEPEALEALQAKLQEEGISAEIPEKGYVAEL